MQLFPIVFCAIVQAEFFLTVNSPGTDIHRKIVRIADGILSISETGPFYRAEIVNDTIMISETLSNLYGTHSKSLDQTNRLVLSRNPDHHFKVNNRIITYQGNKNFFAAKIGDSWQLKTTSWGHGQPEELVELTLSQKPAAAIKKKQETVFTREDTDTDPDTLGTDSIDYFDIDDTQIERSEFRPGPVFANVGEDTFDEGLDSNSAEVNEELQKDTEDGNFSPYIAQLDRDGEYENTGGENNGFAMEAIEEDPDSFAVDPTASFKESDNTGDGDPEVGNNGFAMKTTEEDPDSLGINYTDSSDIENQQNDRDEFTPGPIFANVGEDTFDEGRDSNSVEVNEELQKNAEDDIESTDTSQIDREGGDDNPEVENNGVAIEAIDEDPDSFAVDPTASFEESDNTGDGDPEVDNNGFAMKTTEEDPDSLGINYTDSFDIENQQNDRDEFTPGPIFANVGEDTFDEGRDSNSVEVNEELQKNAEDDTESTDTSQIDREGGDDNPEVENNEVDIEATNEDQESLGTDPVDSSDTDGQQNERDEFTPGPVFADANEDTYEEGVGSNSVEGDEKLPKNAENGIESPYSSQIDKDDGDQNPEVDDNGLTSETTNEDLDSSGVDSIGSFRENGSTEDDNFDNNGHAGEATNEDPESLGNDSIDSVEGSENPGDESPKVDNNDFATETMDTNPEILPTDSIDSSDINGLQSDRNEFLPGPVYANVDEYTYDEDLDSNSLQFEDDQQEDSKNQEPFTEGASASSTLQKEISENPGYSETLLNPASALQTDIVSQYLADEEYSNEVSNITPVTVTESYPEYGVSLSILATANPVLGDEAGPDQTTRIESIDALLPAQPESTSIRYEEVPPAQPESTSTRYEKVTTSALPLGDGSQVDKTHDSIPSESTNRSVTFDQSTYVDEPYAWNDDLKTSASWAISIVPYDDTFTSLDSYSLSSVEGSSSGVFENQPSLSTETREQWSLDIKFETGFAQDDGNPTLTTSSSQFREVSPSRYQASEIVTDYQNWSWTTSSFTEKILEASKTTSTDFIPNPGFDGSVSEGGEDSGNPSYTPVETVAPLYPGVGASSVPGSEESWYSLQSGEYAPGQPWNWEVTLLPSGAQNTFLEGESIYTGVFQDQIFSHVPEIPIGYDLGTDETLPSPTANIAGENSEEGPGGPDSIKVVWETVTEHTFPIRYTTTTSIVEVTASAASTSYVTVYL